MSELRLARPADANRILAIYAPIVESTAISFEVETPEPSEMAARIDRVLARYPWLVYCEGEELLGYAYATAFRGRPAYDWSAETSVYVAEAHRGRRVARALMEALLDLLRQAGFQRALAGIALPNGASTHLHESLGFRHVGTFERIGRKLGAWHPVGFWELALATDEDPAPPRTPQEVLGHASGRAALERARGRVKKPRG